MASASTAVDENVAVPHKKRPRLNPARRRAEQAKASTQGSASDSRTTGVTTELAKPNIPGHRAKIENSQLVGSNAGKRTTGNRPSAGSLSAAAMSSSQATSTEVPHNEKSLVQRPSQLRQLSFAAPAFVSGGLMGCAAGAAVVLGASLLRNSAGTESAIFAARTARLCVNRLIDDMTASLKAGTYNTAEALDLLRRTTLAYASMVPGGVSTVERIFHEINMVRKQRGEELDKIVREAQQDISKVRFRGADLQTAVLRNLVKLSAFTNHATKDIATRDPSLGTSGWYGNGPDIRAPQIKIPIVKLNMTIKNKPAVVA